MLDFRIYIQHGKRKTYTVLLADNHGGHSVAEGIRTIREARRVRSDWRKRWFACRPKERAEIIMAIVEECRKTP